MTRTPHKREDLLPRREGESEAWQLGSLTACQPSEAWTSEPRPEPANGLKIARDRLAVGVSRRLGLPVNLDCFGESKVGLFPRKQLYLISVGSLPVASCSLSRWTISDCRSGFARRLSAVISFAGGNPGISTDLNVFIRVLLDDHMASVGIVSVRVALVLATSDATSFSDWYNVTPPAASSA